VEGRKVSAVGLESPTVMDIRVTETPLYGPLVVEVDYFTDGRGFVMESYNKRVHLAAGITYEWVQDLHSRSTKNVLRGFHFQDGSAPMAKLVRCTQGAILDVIVDLRIGSPTFAQTFAIELTAENKKMLLVPPEFGHAVWTLSDVAEHQYKISNYYTPAAECSIAWNDPEIGFEWPGTEPLLSKRDQNAISLAAYKERPAFFYPPFGGRK